MQRGGETGWGGGCNFRKWSQTSGVGVRTVLANWSGKEMSERERCGKRKGAESMLIPLTTHQSRPSRRRACTCKPTKQTWRLSERVRRVSAAATIDSAGVMISRVLNV